MKDKYLYISRLIHNQCSFLYAIIINFIAIFVVTSSYITCVFINYLKFRRNRKQDEREDDEVIISDCLLHTQLMSLKESLFIASGKQGRYITPELSRY